MMKKRLALVAALFLLVGSPQALATETPASLVGTTCPLCHFCPQPLGFCVLIWAAGFLILLLLLVILTGRGKRCPVCQARNKRRAEICCNCHYNLAAAAYQSSVPPLIANEQGYISLALNAHQPGGPYPEQAGNIWTDRSATANQPIRPAAKAAALPAREYAAPAPAAQQYAAPLSMPAPRGPYTPPLTAARSAPADDHCYIPQPPATNTAASPAGIPPAVKAAASPRPAAVPAASERKPCPYCGKILPARAMFCSECGHRLHH